MRSKKTTVLFAILLILASLLSSGCSTKAGAAPTQSVATDGDALVVIDSSGNALPIVFSFSREVNGGKYYLSEGKELTKEEISSSLAPEGLTVAEVSGIWGISIADVFALFTSAQLSERNSPEAATNAALLYDMWECLTTGPPAIRENPRGTLEGLVPNIDMRQKVFDFLEQHKQASFSY